MHFTIFQSDGITPWTGQAGSCTDYLSRNGAAAPEAVTVAEIGVSGHYDASFTPLTTGSYDLEVTCPDNRVVGDSFEVQANDLDDISTDISTMQGNVTDILADTNETQGKLPTNNIMGSSDKADYDGEIGDILADTNEMQGKLPTNNIMGSSDKADYDGEIGDILADTADMQPRVVDIETDTNEMQGKLPTNNIMGSSVKSDKDDEIDDILADTNEIQGKLPTGTISDFDETTDPVELLDSGGAAGTSAAELVTDIDTDLSASHGAGAWDGTESDWTVAERNQIRHRLALDGVQADPTTNTGTIEDILADTNEMQGKLPTNNIMGSSVKTDKDDEIDAILVDTGTTIPATLSTIEGKVDTVDSNVDAILVDTNEMQGKLPTNNIMGSSVKTDKDDEIDAILVDTNEMQGKLPTNNIMGSSVKTDKDDEIDAIKAVTDTIVNLDTLVDAVWNEIVSGAVHFTPNSTGEALTLIRGLVQQNYMLDSTIYNSDNLLTAGRLRIFTTAAEVSAATDGGSGEGEIATFDITSVEEPADGTLVKTYKVERA